MVGQGLVGGAVVSGLVGGAVREWTRVRNYGYVRYVRLIKLKGTLFVLAGKKNRTRKPVAKKNVVLR